MRQFIKRVIYPFYKSLETDIHPLRYLFIEITQKCNLHCRHCGSDCSSNPKYKELAYKQWINFFEALKRDFQGKNFIIVITGGEPFCNTDFYKIVERLRALGFLWGMVTNGYTLDEKVLQRIVNLNIYTITVSLDGLEKNHNWLRGNRESFKRALNAIKLIAKSGIPYSDVVTCVHPGNLSELDDIKNLIIETGMKYWRLFSIFPKGRALKNRELILSDDETRMFLKWIADARKSTPRNQLVINFSCEGYLPKKIDYQVRDEPYFCRAGINIASVLCDGSISACPNISRYFIQGNILKDNFKDVWEKKFEIFRDRRWMKNGMCAECREWARCQGNSLHLWDEQSNQPVFCHYKILS